MTAFHCIVSNFEKKIVLLLAKGFFSRSFHSCKFFSRKTELCNKMQPKGNLIELSLVFKIWFNWSEKSSIIYVRLGSKYASVSITLHLTFLKITFHRKLMTFFLKFYLKRNKILQVHVQDKSCNSPEGLQLY